MQQARLFGLDGEILIWKDGDGAWNGRSLTESLNGRTDFEEAFDEDYLLIGTHAAGRQSGFTQLRDGSQGLRHAVPISLLPPGVVVEQSVAPPRLRVRHYITGETARIAASRLVNVYPEALDGNPKA